VTYAPGTRLGPYEIRSARDLPGLGEVYDARDHGQWRDVAFRVLRTDFGANPERLRRFEQDTRAAAALIHPNILTIHNIGTDAEAAYRLWSLVSGLRSLVLPEDQRLKTKDQRRKTPPRFGDRDRQFCGAGGGVWRRDPGFRVPYGTLTG